MRTPRHIEFFLMAKGSIQQTHLRSTWWHPSLNFQGWTWLEEVDGEVNSPYDRLAKLFEEMDHEKLELMTHDNKIQHGGVALTAYGRLQFSEMCQVECEALCQGLLKYCEPDIVAMVMLYEGWLEMVNPK